MSKKGKAAQQLIYSSGKKFGYRFSLIGGFSNSSDKTGSDLINYVNIINKFIEGTYATKIEFQADLYSKIFRYKMENPIVINKLGYGYFLPLGAAAGLMSYIFQDTSIEGVIENFDMTSGIGTMLYAPVDYLNNQNKKFFRESNLTDLAPTDEYIDFNKTVQLKNSKYSFKTLIDSKIFTFNNGMIKCNNERYFILEVSAIYILEKDLSAYADQLYAAAFKAGNSILKNAKNASIKTVTDYLTAFGWGDVIVLNDKNKYTVNVSHFPYTQFYKEVNYVIFSGIISGMISTITNEDVRFTKIQKTLSDGSFSISLFS